MADNERTFPKIAHLDMKGKFFKVKDSLGVEPKNRKLYVEIFQYDPKPNAFTKHSIDVDDFLYLSYLIRTGKLAVKPPSEDDQKKLLAQGFTFVFADYKGSRSDKWQTGYEARVLRVERQIARSGTGTVLSVTIDNGPGVLTEGGTGAVKMAPGAEGKKSLYFHIPEADAVKLTMQVEQYLNAWAAHNFTGIRQACVDWDAPTERQAAPAVEERRA